MTVSVGCLGRIADVQGSKTVKIRHIIFFRPLTDSHHGVCVGGEWCGGGNQINIFCSFEFKKKE